MKQVEPFLISYGNFAQAIKVVSKAEIICTHILYNVYIAKKKEREIENI
jgi:hypothetical protein